MAEHPDIEAEIAALLIDLRNRKAQPAPLPFPSFVTLKTGRFPHQAYRPDCACMDGQPQDVKNYANHIVAPPRCSVCRVGYRLDITLMPTYQPRSKT